jgi:hypothetical protein
MISSRKKIVTNFQKKSLKNLRRFLVAGTGFEPVTFGL